MADGKNGIHPVSPVHPDKLRPPMALGTGLGPRTLLPLDPDKLRPIY